MEQHATEEHLLARADGDGRDDAEDRFLQRLARREPQLRRDGSENGAHDERERQARNTRAESARELHGPPRPREPELTRGAEVEPPPDADDRRDEQQLQDTARDTREGDTA